jgi:hypothetical protein
LILLPESQQAAASLNLSFNSRVYYIGHDLVLWELYKLHHLDAAIVRNAIGGINATNFASNTPHIWSQFDKPCFYIHTCAHTFAYVLNTFFYDKTLDFPVLVL